MVKEQMDSQVFFIQARRDEGDDVISQKTAKIFLKAGFYKKLEPDSLVACKIHFGEKGNKGHIKPAWLKDIITQLKKKSRKVFLTDTNTLYVGHRSNSIDHILLAEEHGFSLENVNVPVIIADGLVGHDEEEVEINRPRLKTARIASAFLHSEALICLTHFTGHIQTGFGASIKNIGMGCASRAGKLAQHSDVQPWVNTKLCKNCGICFEYCPVEAIVQKEESAFILREKCIGCGQCLVVCPTAAVKMRWDSDSRRIQEKMAEYAYAVKQRFGDKIVFINFLLQITKNCDCMGGTGPAIIEDIGLLASSDPVAVDAASVELINRRAGRDLLREKQDIDWSWQLKHGQRIGLGSLDYELIEIE